MRILVAPDKFAGTLSAVQAAAAIADGWASHAPGDTFDLAPMSDGGPGFVEVLHASLGGDLLAVTVTGPYGDPVPATVLMVGDTAYVEAAQACGLDLTPPPARRPEEASTRGVGELIAAAQATDASRIVVGLGGTATNDGGAGMLAGLGAVADVPLDRGPRGLAGITRLELPAVDVELIAASDVDNQLLGLYGATKAYGPQKGLAEDRIPAVDGLLEEFATVANKRLALKPGAGAAGGLGYALLLLGASRRPGLDVVAEATDLAGRARAADLVVSGEGSLDFSSRSGKVPVGVAAVAASVARPCLVLAGQVHLGAREMRASNIESAYSVAELVGEDASMADPAGSLAALAQRVARTWSRR